MTWTNYGDVNPRIHGGLFIKRTPDGFEIVETTELNEVSTNDKGANYLFQHSIVTSAELLADKALARFCDLGRLGDASDDDKALDLARSYIGYYGGQSEEYQTTNYYKGLRRYGIRPRHVLANR